MIDGSWVPITVAAIAAIATVTGQYLLNRREPFAIVRLQRLSQAIESMPEDDGGRGSLVEARTVLANRLASSLIGPRGFARLLRNLAWVLAAAGTAFTVFWIVSVRVLNADPNADTGKAILNIGISMLVTSPIILGYSALWPYLVHSVNVTFRWYAELLISLVGRLTGHSRRQR